MAYCTKCGTKNEDDAEFCKKCGASLTGVKKEHEKDDDCVCSGSKQNPLVPVFWGIVVILFGLWIVFSFIIPRDYLPAGLQEFSFWGLILLIIAVAVILTGFRILTKKHW
ncbi:MAG: zinc-ribbon domain-containing protein [Thermoplasmatales archaeon]|nr:MAG: zinc-ribbon domain-containing protein [Thermoplasmatales archaeon]